MPFVNLPGPIYPALKGWARDNQKYFLLPILLCLFNCSAESGPTLPSMELEPGSLREIAYTDKGDVIWVTTTGNYNKSPWHGLTASKQAYFEDVFIYADGDLLPRAEATITVDPVKMIREYPASGIKETWTLLDDQHTLLINLEARKATQWRVQPAILGGSHDRDFDFNTTDSELNIHYKRLANSFSKYNYLNVRFSQPMEWRAAESPGLPLFTAYLTPAAECEASHKLSITISLLDQNEKMDIDPVLIIREREDRIRTRLGETRVISNSIDLDHAIVWAHASLDALIMNQTGKGIYAGLPWFDDYWGRDVFISFAGATLVSGQFDEAKQILLTFAGLQNKNPDDQNYGRVPNRAQPNDIIYNTTDGTPWFVRSIWDYYRYTGDEVFLAQLWPAIQIATTGAMNNWMDESGLLEHDEADTWMDARSPDGAWSPRGDRAIEIQFIWRDQLEITNRLAEKFGDSELKEQTEGALSRLTAGLKLFRSGDDTYFVDHINRDDALDQQIRPNVFLVPPLFDETCDWSTFKYLGPQLVTKDGVFSLSQQDANFHPYHHVSNLYVQDAAYHNGIIWTWNSAATITQAIRFQQYHYAQALFDNLTDQIINRGAIGTISELTDAWERDGELKLSGTFSQAWSLGEYLRTFYQDILGIQPDLTKSRIHIKPRLLRGMEQISFNVLLGNDHWEMVYNESASSFDIDIERDTKENLELLLNIRDSTNASQLELTWNTKHIHLRYEKQMAQWTVPSEYEDYKTSSKAIDLPINSLPFCQQDTTIQVPALMGPKHRLLKKQEVVFQGGTYRLVMEQADEEGDDSGDNGQYIYPSNSHFESGIADIIGMQINRGESDYLIVLEYAKLVDPGWHPEYGYQLTYTALGISYDPKTGTRELGKNSQTTFKSGFKADQILYISGGVLLVDDQHQPIAEYLPNDPSGAIGNARANFIQFRIPENILMGKLEAARFQIAVGCQDDHGGAGIGDFRVVNAQVGEWSGGGKTGTLTSNVYDWLIP
ncbi:MAG: hypothetical protein K9N35_08355 [Candidatus Marinimicrobia bacterium]|nr:hypothetical protein [Candidatus Neomarinimicrobiota bacterium]